jgi:hypothetical protein
VQNRTHLTILMMTLEKSFSSPIAAHAAEILTQDTTKLGVLLEVDSVGVVMAGVFLLHLLVGDFLISRMFTRVVVSPFTNGFAL